MRCKACDKPMSNSELRTDEELCKRCLREARLEVDITKDKADDPLFIDTIKVVDDLNIE